MKLRSVVFAASTAALIVALALLSNALITSGSQATTTQTGEDSSSKTTLTIIGYGSIRYSPDMFDITLIMIGQDESAQEAFAECNQKVTAVIDALKSLGITEEYMETRYVYLNPLYDWEQKPPRIIGYEAQYVLGVKIRDADKVGRAIDEAVRAGADRLDGIVYTLSPGKTNELKNNAIKAAIEDAKTKASLIAETLGLEVIGIESVGISEFIPTPPIVYRYDTAVAQPSIPIIPGEGEVTATVTIVFRLGPAA